MGTSFSYAIVIVTYNRLKMLKRCLEHAFGQTLPPKDVIVIDNCSNDGTREFLQEDYLTQQAKEKGIRLTVRFEKKNVGGAGGFCDGLKTAMEESAAEWILLIDDDAILDYDCMQEMNPETASHYAQAYACSVFFKGERELSHRKNKRGAMPALNYEKEEFLCDYTSFCGSMFHRELVEQIGYPLKEYFIWFDDTEYSMRVRKHSKIVVRTRASLQHGDPDLPDQRAKVDWRYYYGTRNHLDMLKRHHRSLSFAAFGLEAGLIVLLRDFRSVLHRNDKDKQTADLEEREIFLDGLRDGVRGRLGMRKKYLPGNAKQKV